MFFTCSYLCLPFSIVLMLHINSILPSNHILLSREHKNQLQVPSGHDITRTQQEEFPKWFKERVRCFPISLCAKYYQVVL